MSKKQKIFFAIMVVVLVAASRLVKHPFNFTPVVAMSIFAGYYLKNKWGVLFPLASMVISDYFIGFYDWQVMFSVYISVAIAFAIGWLIQNKRKAYIPLSAVVSSAVFFLITNFSVWAFFDWYPHTWPGLVNCFTLALPFFRNSLLGDIFYTTAVFTLFEFATVLLEKRAHKHAAIDAV